MAKHEGLVERISKDGTAEVVIRPGAPGIIGAPEVSKKVCHSATDGSTVRTVAVNKAGARVGDWVVVSFDTNVLRNNAILLLGIPAVGGIIGLLLGVVTGGGGVQGVGVAVFATLGVLLGIMIGGAMYKRSAGKNLPMVSQVVKPHAEVMASLSKQGPAIKEGNGCDLCSGCIK